MPWAMQNAGSGAADLHPGAHLPGLQEPRLAGDLEPAPITRLRGHVPDQPVPYLVLLVGHGGREAAHQDHGRPDDRIT
jgi:hypothetical protein